MTVNALKLI